MRVLPLALLLGGCTSSHAVRARTGLARYLPGGPVLSDDALAPFAAPRASDATYTGPARVNFPVLPLQVFGLDYALDLVVSTTHPDWDMHEYARIDVPGQAPIWLAKDARPDGQQIIVTDREDAYSLVATVPITRIASPLEVDDHSEGRKVRVEIAYVNADGKPVHVDFRGKLPKEPPAKRNGSTMGHSSHAVAAVLDLERNGHAAQVKMTIDGKRYPLKKLLGIYPMHFVLEQAQGGIAAANFRQSASDGGFLLQRPAPGYDGSGPHPNQPAWPTRRDERWTVTGAQARWTDNLGLLTYTYTFLDGGLARARVDQAGRPAPVFEMWFSPALPDLARPFQGVARSSFRMDVNGQKGHGTGQVLAWWEDDRTVRVQFEPRSPWWLAVRPMAGTVRYPGDGSAIFTMLRTDSGEDPSLPERYRGLDD